MVFDIQNAFESLSAKETRAVLKINGNNYNTWKSISIQRSIVQIAGSFSFSTANIYSGQNEKWNITTGDKCTIEVAGKTVITGYIDDIDNGYDLGRHDITFSGRDKTGDLVDCSYDISPEPEVRGVGSFPYYPPAGKGEFKNLSFLQILEKLCDPFNVDVVLDSKLSLESYLFDTIANYTPESGSKVYEQIVTLCNQFAVLPVPHPNGSGNLYITRSGTERVNDVLEVSKNIKANRLNQSDKDRYSVYYVSGIPSQTIFNQKSTARGKLVDNYVKRYRPLWILAGEDAISDDACQKRAASECRIRAGGSRKVDTLVRGWTQSNGDIWPLNKIVSVKDKKIGVDGEFLIAGLDFTIDSSGGELARLGLVPPDTFELKERVPVANKKVTAFDQLRDLK